MIDELHAIVLKPVALISSVSVAWAFSYGVYLGSAPVVETQPVSIAMQQSSNPSPEQVSEVLIEPSPLQPANAVESMDITLDAKTIDQELMLTPVPEATIIVSPSPKPTLKPEATPALTKAPVAVVPVSDYEPLFEQWSAHFGVDINLLKHIARCESRFNPAAVGGIYGGMYQFSSSTWQSTRAAMDHETDPNLRFDANEAIKTAAFKIASGGQSAWKNCLPK
jgi:hypothetical protein